MYVFELEPSIALANYIEKYLFCTTGENHYPYWFKALPNGYTELFLNVHGSNFIIQSKRYRFENPKAFFVGLHDVYADSYIKNNSPMRSFIIVFKPGALSCLLKIDESKLINQIEEATTLLGAKINTAWEEIDSTTSYEKMKDIVDDYFTEYLKSALDIDSEITNVIEQIVERNGFKSMEELSRQSGFQERRLERLFKARIGITPIQYLQIIRLNNLFRLSINQQKLTELALESGYYDQAHFNKDFKKITLMTPKSFFEKVGSAFYDKIATNRVFIPFEEREVSF